MTYCAWGVSTVQRCDLWAWRRNEKKDRNFHASNWLFAQTTHVDIGPWNFSRGVVSGNQLYISSFMKIGPGVSELWGRKSPSPIDKAHGLYNSLYYHRTTVIISTFDSGSERPSAKLSPSPWHESTDLGTHLSDVLLHTNRCLWFNVSTTRNWISYDFLSKLSNMR